MKPTTSPSPHEPGAQRLSLTRLREWEELKYGLFIHFGMSTFDGDELSMGNSPSTQYAPDKLDVDQWVSVARDAGMKYAILTTKHVSGHALWPSRHTDYHVGTSANPINVVEKFVAACARRGIKPGFYYCSWDNHHRFGSLTPSDVRALPAALQMKGGPYPELFQAYATPRYWDFQLAQLEELLTGYGPVMEVWIDIPGLLPRGVRAVHYEQIARWQKDAVIMMNHGVGDGTTEFSVPYAWPTDLVAIERFLPNSYTGHLKWRNIEGGHYYLPNEVCDTIGAEWFQFDTDQPRSDAELLGMYLTSVSRGANFLLNVPPDRHGLIPDRFVQALMRLRRNLDRAALD